MQKIAGGAALAALCACILAGCAAKQVTSVPMTQAGDDQLDCSQLAQQIKSNQNQADYLQKKDQQVSQENVAKNVAGAIIPYAGVLAIASTDLSNEEQVNARALTDRNEELTYLARKKGCTQ